MDPMSNVNEPAKELLDAQTHVWNHIFSHHKSMALKCAIELGIPDAIQKHGKPITLHELTNSLFLNQNKAPSLYRLMRLLIHSNFFSKRLLSSGEEAFDLNINSKLLLKDHPLTLTPFALFVLDPVTVGSSFNICNWFQNEDETPFHVTHGKSIWEYAACVPKHNNLVNEAMASDAQFVASLLLANTDFRGLIEGVESLVDVGGGIGTLAKAFAKDFPGLSCIVFDLPHVVKGLEGYDGRLKFVGGDMFDAIPPAQTVLLKSIMHDWSDDDCAKILRRCNEAIPSKDRGGKIIIIDIVLQTNNENDINNNNASSLNSQFLFDMVMMSVAIGGKERSEEEWKKLFIGAGFNGYKIYPILGSRSVIEVYPF